MPPRPRMPECSEELPMDVTDGEAGLAQSKHHPNAGLGGYSNATPRQAVREKPRESRGDTLEEALKNLSQLLARGNWDASTLEAAARRATTAWTRQQTGRNSDDNEPIKKGDLKRIIREELTALQSTQATQPTKKTWAAVAATATTSRTNPVQEPAKVVPARHLREVIVKSTGASADIRKRSAKETVQAVNTASSKKGAVAARQLPSGDMVVTFQEQEAREWHNNNRDWVVMAFGPSAYVCHRLYTVVAKGIRISAAKAATEIDIMSEASEENRVKINGVKIKIPRSNSAKYATVLLQMESIEQANQLCERGLVWEAQIYQCEPFIKDLRPQQCFKCWKFGHVAKWCKATATCGRCAATAHAGGEGECPSNYGRVARRCPACGGNHTVWDRECEEANKQWRIAREAHAFRPTRFTIERHEQGQRQRDAHPGRATNTSTGMVLYTGGSQPGTSKKRGATLSTEELREEVARKSGRPKNIARPECGQRRLQFSSQSTALVRTNSETDIDPQWEH